MSLLLALSFLNSCGYRFASSDADGHRPTVSVPFVSGDEEGFLSAEIVRCLSASGLVDVVSSRGDYQLKVAIKDHSREKIGFRIDPQKIDGEVRNRLLATEGRKNMRVEASLWLGDELILGPYLIMADEDYDYVDGDSLEDLTFVNTRGMTELVLPFSLGQLEPVDSAENAAARPLYRKIAEKIVDALAFEW